MKVNLAVNKQHKASRVKVYLLNLSHLEKGWPK